MLDRSVFFSRDTDFKSPFGAVTLGAPVTFTLRPHAWEGFTACTLLTYGEFADCHQETTLSPAGSEGDRALFSGVFSAPEAADLDWSEQRLLGVRYADTKEPVPLSSDLAWGEELFATVPVEDADRPLEVFLGEEPELDKKSLVLYLLLFALCLAVVLRLIGWYVMLPLLIVVLLILDRRRLKEADFMLLLTFVCFFVFAGNLARVPAVEALLSRLLLGRELLAGALVSQVISNVPAALLLSGFTENGRELLLGVNIGGLGTPIASLASLISLKLYSHSEHSHSGKYLGLFSLVNFALLIALLLGYSLL